MKSATEMSELEFEKLFPSIFYHYDIFILELRLHISYQEVFLHFNLPNSFIFVLARSFAYVENVAGEFSHSKFHLLRHFDGILMIRLNVVNTFTFLVSRKTGFQLS